jgi:glycosyltransferase involved in cell wall biosynthesis
VGVNGSFDRWVAGRLERCPPEIFVGTETCDLHSLATAKKAGIKRVHDCPQLHPDFLQLVLNEAAERAGLPAPGPAELPEMTDRKREEYALAEYLLIYSDVHRRSFESAGFPPDRLFQCPLWVDSSLWFRESGIPRPDKALPLKLLFVGSVNLRKGMPFLMQALKQCGREVELTIVGPHEASSRTLLQGMTDRVRLLAPQSKARLRETYEQHDVFVLPSVADSFGFVALEAMACGLPAIVTENCGAPVPDPSWRVPAMNPGALASRIQCYAQDRIMLEEHARMALDFASRFGPGVYRKNVGSFFQKLLSSR